MMKAKILIATPTSKRHEYVIEKYLDRVRALSYPSIHLLLYDNTMDNGEYYEKLKAMTPEKWITVKRHEWDPRDAHVLQMLANVKESMRMFMMAREFTHYFDIASDMMLPKNIIERLLSHKKDIVGAVTRVYGGKVSMPMLMKWRGSAKKSGWMNMSGGLDLMTWDEAKKLRGLVRVYACSVALYGRKVMETVPWRTHPEFIYGEDLWFFTETNDKGFEWWCDTDIRVEHKNIPWGNVPSFREQGLYFAIGPENPEGVDIIERRPREDSTEIV